MSKEDVKLRDRHGRTNWGHSTLLAPTVKPARRS